jgi:hypothetical protein
MESGIALTFGSFIAEIVLFIVALWILLVQPSTSSTLKPRWKLGVFLLATMTLCALASLVFPALLIRSAMTGESSFAWPYFVVFGGAPLMLVVIWTLLRREKRKEN